MWTFRDKKKKPIAFVGKGVSFDTGGVSIKPSPAMYVNEVTVDMGEAGEKAVRLMFEMAKEKGLVPDFELKISKPL